MYPGKYPSTVTTKAANTVDAALAREVDVPLPSDGEADTHAEAERTRNTPSVDVICGDAIDVLRGMPADSIHAVITSPPYMGLRSYNIPTRRWDDGSACVLGDEQTVELYTQHMVEVMRELKRVLHPSGSLWLNIGDSYAGGGRHVEPVKYPNVNKPKRPKQKRRSGKDLLLVPARVALAMQADGWILRQDIVWAKAVSFLKCFSGSVMPESTRDRCVHAFEHVFHFVQQDHYYYDIDGSREPYADVTRGQLRSPYTGKGQKAYADAGAQNPSDVKRRVLASVTNGAGRNLRNVWIIPKQNYPGSHHATFPERLPEIVIKLATSEKGVCEVCREPWRRRVVREVVPAHIRERFEAARAVTAGETGRTDGHTSKRPNYRRKVLREEWEAGCHCGRGIIPSTVMDIFSGSGRAGIVAKRLERSFIGIDANPEYVRMAQDAIAGSRIALATEKQATTGRRTYNGFNKRWKEQHDNE